MAGAGKGWLSKLFDKPTSSRREKKIPEFGTEYHSNTRWIREGKVDHSDILPWLRGVQKMGYELTIIGSTLEACNVCIEAWAAGFKPVLIIMEDQLASQKDEGEQVRSMMDAMLSCVGDTGFFRHGPVLIYSDSKKCCVHLDDQGRVTDTLVRTNIAGVNSHSESWQLFKGPAIVVDLFAIPGVDAEKAKARMEEMRMKKLQSLANKKFRIADEFEHETSFFDPEEPAVVESMSSTVDPGIGSSADCIRNNVRKKDKMTATRGKMLGSSDPFMGGDLPVKPSPLEKLGSPVIVGDETVPSPREEAPSQAGAVEQKRILGDQTVVMDEEEGDEAPGQERSIMPERAQVSMAEKGERFLARSALERDAITDPAFWEKRYDPDCGPMTTATYDSVAPLLLICIWFSFNYVYQYNFMRDDFWGPWRTLWKMWSEGLSYMGLVSMYYTSLGLAMPMDRPSGLVLITGIVMVSTAMASGCFKFWGFYLSDFSCAVLAMNVSIVFMPIYVYWKTRRMSLWQLAWYVACLTGTFGYWLICCIVILVYLVLMTVNDTAASLFLTVAFSGAESMTVELMLVCYNKFVYYKRKDDPNKVIGEQKMTFGWAIVATHAFTESSRLVALVCGSVRAGTMDHLNSVALSAASALFLNVFSRTMWMVIFYAWVLGPKRAGWVCPSFITAYHMDCKFAVGWIRFFVMLGISLGRGAMWGNWNTEWIQTEPTMWCFNGVVLLTVLIMLVAEVMEDWLVFTVNGKMPAPVWGFFSEAMLEQFNLPKHGDIFHTSHFLVPVETLPSPGDSNGKALDNMINARGDVRKVKKLSSHVGPIMTDLAARLSASPNFRHAKHFQFMPITAVVGACLALMFCGFNVGLGPGSFAGYCRPLKLEGTMGVIIRNLMLTAPYCEYEVDWSSRLNATLGP